MLLTIHSDCESGAVLINGIQKGVIRGVFSIVIQRGIYDIQISASAITSTNPILVNTTVSKKPRYSVYIGVCYALTGYRCVKADGHLEEVETTTKYYEDETIMLYAPNPIHVNVDKNTNVQMDRVKSITRGEQYTKKTERKIEIEYLNVLYEYTYYYDLVRRSCQVRRLDSSSIIEEDYCWNGSIDSDECISDVDNPRIVEVTPVYVY